MQKAVQEIFAFNRNVLGVQQPDTPRALSDAEKQFAKTCFMEEMHELERSHSPVDQIDALVDSLYFGVGRAYRLGYEVDNLCIDISSALADIKDSFDREAILNIQPRKIKALDSTMLHSLCKKQAFLADALATTNGRAGQAHIVCQIIGTSLFALHRMNLTAEQARECIMIVDRANKKKKRGVKAGRSGEVDAVKPEGFESPEAAITKYLEL